MEVRTNRAHLAVLFQHDLRSTAGSPGLQFELVWKQFHERRKSHTTKRPGKGRILPKFRRRFGGPHRAIVSRQNFDELIGKQFKQFAFDVFLLLASGQPERYVYVFAICGHRANGRQAVLFAVRVCDRVPRHRINEMNGSAI